MDRRTFVRGVSAVAAATGSRTMLGQLGKSTQTGGPAPVGFPAGDPKWKKTWDAALEVLAGNARVVPKFSKPVLIEGAVYPGIWQECGPHEGLVYATLAKYVPERKDGITPVKLAGANHVAFFDLQKDDGQLPASVKMTEVGYGQIQMVVPIAATAWELVELTKDEELLAMAYKACSAWDGWLRKYRDTRKTGLVEGFCTYDTGHDNSPRWKGIPNRCPDADAKKFPAIPGMPRICPDLSATVYGGRVALAKMAAALGYKSEVMRWQEDAEKLRKLILAKLYSPEDAAFYDLDTDNKFIKVRGDVISRVLGEHVLQADNATDMKIFDAIWERQIHNPKAFWAKFPLPSIAMDDPTFVRPIPRNSWGGATQALTALRAPRWMEYYGKGDALRVMMTAWVKAVADSGGFRQQMDPDTGAFTMADPSGYSPCALVYLDYIRRLQA